MYKFNLDTSKELASQLAHNVQQRRLEKGLSRAALSHLSDVPAPTIAKFEQFTRYSFADTPLILQVSIRE